MSYFKGIGRKSGSYAGRKLPLIGLLENKKHTIFNEYTVGSGVGASSVVTRRLKKQRAKIKTCTPPAPIYPKIDYDNVFIVSDEIEMFDQLQGMIDAAPYEATINFETDENANVDGEYFERTATKHINAIVTSDIMSLTFTTISHVNPADNAVANNVAATIDDVLSREKYTVTTSTNVETTSDYISQNIEHTFVNTGKNSDGHSLIEYIMTITVFESL